MVIVTGAAALFFEGSLLADLPSFALVLLGLYLTGGSANALNQYFERDIDAQMTRTKSRRPLPQNKMTPNQALGFSIAIGILGVAVFAVFFNTLSALLALGTVLFYGFIYTLILKPLTYLNIVIGGAAGAMAPPIAWAAATGTVSAAAWVLALVIFMWTPPHFWALALFRKNDYIKVELPMMPVVRGDRATLNQILVYTVLLVAVSLVFSFFGASFVYTIAAAALGAGFMQKAAGTRRHSTQQSQRGLFGYSITYLLALFGTVMIDKLL
jgi:protoheme IX farnesyltransferase